MPLGDPPNYSTPSTISLALVSSLGSMAHFTLGALEYGRVGPLVGLWQMVLAAFLLVFGVLTTIRYFEARDALGDRSPRTPMYDTPHEWWTYRVGVFLHALGVLLCLYWMLRSELTVFYGAALLVNLLGFTLAFRIRPRRDEV